MQKVAWCLGGLGAFLVVRKAAKQAWRRYQEHQARERVRKALAQAQAGSGAAGGIAEAVGSTAVGDEEMGGVGGRDAGVCVVCLSAPAEMVYVRCGHLCCCQRCSQALAAKKCPVCRTEGSVIKVFRT